MISNQITSFQLIKIYLWFITSFLLQQKRTFRFFQCLFLLERLLALFLARLYGRLHNCSIWDVKIYTILSIFLTLKHTIFYSSIYLNIFGTNKTKMIYLFSNLYTAFSLFLLNNSFSLFASLFNIINLSFLLRPCSINLAF